MGCRRPPTGQLRGAGAACSSCSVLLTSLWASQRTPGKAQQSFRIPGGLRQLLLWAGEPRESAHTCMAQRGDSSLTGGTW